MSVKTGTKLLGAADLRCLLWRLKLMESSGVGYRSSSTVPGGRSSGDEMRCDALAACLVDAVFGAAVGLIGFANFQGGNDKMIKSFLQESAAVLAVVASSF